MIVNNPIVVRMCAMLDQLEEEPLRAAYMVVAQLHALQTKATGEEKKNVDYRSTG